MASMRGEPPLAGMLSRLKVVDVSPLVRLGARIAPEVFDIWLRSLDPRQRRAVDSVMPAGGKKRLYFHLVDTPTPPIVIGMGQPIRIVVGPECGLEENTPQKMRGVRLTTDDLQLLVRGRGWGNVLRLLWRLRSQAPSLAGITWILVPLLRLGPSQLKDMGSKLTSRWKPLLDLLTQPR